MPVHVAWVASGTGRWARQRSAAPAEVAGAVDGALAELAEGALELGLRWLTVHAPPGPAPGAEPGPAPADEVAAATLTSWAERQEPWARRRGVAVRLLGPGGFAGPAGAAHLPEVDGPGATGSSGAGDPALVLTLAVGYSGRGEIVDAVRRLAAEGVAADKVDEAAIGRSLYDPAMPDPDLVVRSGADHRISDLLLWEVAYSELVFVDDPWPETTRAHLFDAVVEFQRRDRRYGGLVASGERP